MAQPVPESGSGTHTLGGLTRTVSFTLSGTNRCLIVFLHHNNVTPTGITYNGTAMTSLSTQTTLSVIHLRAYYLLDASLPSNGTYNIVVSLPDGQFCTVGAICLSNVQQTSTFGTVSKSGANNITSLSRSISTNIDDLCIDAITTSTTNAPNSGQTEFYHVIDATDGVFCSSYKAGTGSSVTMGYNWAGTQFAHSMAFTVRGGAGVIAVPRSFGGWS